MERIGASEPFTYSMFVWSKLSSPKWRDAWEERFHGGGQTNAVITEIRGNKSIRVEVYVPRLEQAEAIRDQFGGSIRQLKMENWAAKAPPASKPVRVRDQFIITNTTDEKKVEALRDENPDRQIIHIPPELAFGTGDHPTTATCLRLLCDVASELQSADRKRWSLLDLGTGTGVLAIAGRKLGAGAKDILATDYDPLAIKVAKSNAKRNGAPGIRFEQSDITEWSPPRRFDVIVANIFANVLIASVPQIKRAMVAEGHLIVSGILLEHWDDVKKALVQEGISVTQVEKRGKWVTALCRR